MIKKIKSGVSDAVDTLDSKLKDTLSYLSDLKDTSWEKVTALINDILGLAPLIEVTGYSMKDLNVNAGIPPSTTLSFIKEKEVDAATIQKLLEENKDKDILTLIVKGLQKADSLQQGMNLSHYKFIGLGMKIGLPPNINLMFTRDEKTNDK